MSVSGLVMDQVEAGVVLYIEDNPVNTRLVKSVLATIPNIEFLATVTAEEGIECAISHHPDLILMDINLPGMSGLEALQRLQDEPVTRDIPVIAVTADALPASIQHGLQAGFKHYLTKPIDIHQLRVLVMDALMLDPGKPVRH